MKIFKNMPLNEAKDFYNKLKAEKDRLVIEHKDISFLKIALENIDFFTDGLRKDY